MNIILKCRRITNPAERGGRNELTIPYPINNGSFLSQTAAIDDKTSYETWVTNTITRVGVCKYITNVSVTRHLA